MWSFGLCRDIHVVTWSVQEYSAQSCVIMWSHWSQQNEAQKQIGISTLNSLLKVQFNVPQKCYEFKPNTEH